MQCTLPAVCALIAVCGCQSTQTRKHANELISTTTDLYYQQVLDNIALAYAKPGDLPFFGLPTQGTHTNTRTMQAAYTPSWDFITSGAFLGHYLFDRQAANLGGSVANAEAFQLQPAFDPEKLLLLQVAFHLAAGDPTLTIRQTSWITRFYVARPDSLGFSRQFYWAITRKDLNIERDLIVRIDAIQRSLQSLGQDALQKGKDSEPHTRMWPESAKEILANIIRDQIKAEQAIARAANASEKQQSRGTLASIHNFKSRFLAAQGLGESDVSSFEEFVRAGVKVEDTTREMEALLNVAKLTERDLDRPDPTVMPANWFVVAQKKEHLPKSACHIGHACDLWVGVPAEFTRQLSLFTAAILDIASISNTPVLSPHSITKSDGSVAQMPARPATGGVSKPPGAPPSPASGQLLTPRVYPFPYPMPPQ